MDVDSNTFRVIMRRIAAPVVVVTMCNGDEARGMTASSFTSVSLVPPLVSICVDKSSRAHEIMLDSEYFVINILADDQGALADLFAEAGLTGPEQLLAVSHRSELGVPVLEDTLAWLCCRTYGVCEGGDHSIFLGEVVQLGLGRDGGPLLFYNRAYDAVRSLRSGE